MKKQRWILGMLGLALLLGGCYGFQQIPSKRLDRAQLPQNAYYRIGGVELKDGKSHTFDTKSDTLRARFGLPYQYQGAVLRGDTLYGTTSSYVWLPIAVDRIRTSEQHWDAEGNLRIDAIHLSDGQSFRFGAKDAVRRKQSGVPTAYLYPFTAGDTLFAPVYAVHSLAIPVDQVTHYKVYKWNPAVTVGVIGGTVGLIVYGLHYAVSQISFEFKWE
jgi:hypothetical protein